jgi:hypothetical protein
VRRSHRGATADQPVSAAHDARRLARPQAQSLELGGGESGGGRYSPAAVQHATDEQSIRGKAQQAHGEEHQGEQDFRNRNTAFA